MSGPSLTVLRQFVAGANAQYRAAGLGAYQMRVSRTGTVTVPRRPKAAFRSPQGTERAGAEQARAGARARPAPTGTGAAATPVSRATSRTGAAPAVTGLRPTGQDSFDLAWAPAPGAVRYGIWQDGRLIGHVPSPRFIGVLAAGSAGVIQVDAVREDGTRSELTRPLRVHRGADGTMGFAAAAPQQADAAAPVGASPAAPAADPPAPATVPATAPATAPGAPTAAAAAAG